MRNMIMTRIEIEVDVNNNNDDTEGMMILTCTLEILFTNA
jgi:hypothetical protein